MGNMYTGNIGNNQEAHSTGGTLDQKSAADFKFTIPGMEGMGGAKGEAKGGKHLLMLMNLNGVQL